MGVVVVGDLDEPVVGEPVGQSAACDVEWCSEAGSGWGLGD